MCYTCDDKGYFSSKCKDGRGPAPRGHQSVRTYDYETVDLPVRPVPSSRISSHHSGVSHIPAGVSIRGGSSSRNSSRSSHRASDSIRSVAAPSSHAAGSIRSVAAPSGHTASSIRSVAAPSGHAASSIRSGTAMSSHGARSVRSVVAPSTYAGSIVSVLSEDSIQAIVNHTRTLTHLVKNLDARFERIVLMRKQLSHKTKKISDKEYEQQLNSPSNLVLYEQYKRTEVEAARLGQAAFDHKGNFHHNYARATEDQHLTSHELHTAWVNAVILTAERRLEFMEMFPFACLNKTAIEGHLEAAVRNIRSARAGLRELNTNEDLMYAKIGRAVPVGEFA